MPAELLDAVPSTPSAEEQPVSGIRWLIDNAAGYDALLKLLAGARETIWLSQLAFDSDCVAYDADDADDAAPGRHLIDAILDASRVRGVEVRILLNESLLLDTAAPLRGFLAKNNALQVQVRGIRHFPQLLHAKVAVVDGAHALLVGSPFANGYWDDPRHRPRDARRPARELGGRPLHDVSCLLEGAAAGAIASCFAELWNEASIGPGARSRLPCPTRSTASTGAHEASDTTATRSTASDAVRIVRSVPRGALAAYPDGIAEILPAIVDGIRRARSLLYIEHQYLSARPVIDALSAALERTSELEIIIVLNQNPDVTAYRGWQNARLSEAGLLDHPRVGIFSLWTAERRTDAPVWDMNQVFVHSKVLIADDVWATTGSANLDGVSLHSYGDDFDGRAGRRVFRHVRNYDVNVVLDDSHVALGGAARELREELWREHLGELPATRGDAGDGGWLAHWRACAKRNVAALNDRTMRLPYRGFVLPYSPCSTPRAQLADIGVQLDEERHCLHFNPGWLEVHCSPNWVRNMFL